MLFKPVLLHEQTLEREVPQLVNVLEDVLIARLVILEELVEEAASDGVILGHWAQELDHLGQVIVCLAIVLPFARVKKEIASNQLKSHASH